MLVREKIVPKITRPMSSRPHSKLSVSVVETIETSVILSVRKVVKKKCALELFWSVELSAMQKA